MTGRRSSLIGDVSSRRSPSGARKGVASRKTEEASKVSAEEAEEQDGRRPRKVWMNAVLEEHNKRRMAHWTPALMWSDECYDHALLQAEACAEKGMPVGGHCDGLSGPHGQCIAGPFGTEEYGKLLEGTARDAERVISRWYAEGAFHSYDNPEPKFETRNFSQMMWFATTSVGMAFSKDGQYCVANYFQPGLDPMRYARNIRPKREGLPPWRPKCEDSFVKWQAQWEEFERQEALQAKAAAAAAAQSEEKAEKRKPKAVAKKGGHQLKNSSSARSPSPSPGSRRDSTAAASPGAKKK